MSLSEVSASFGSVFKLLLVSPVEVFLGRKNQKFENTARVREKVHEVQTYQVASNSDPTGIAETDPPKKFP